MEVGTRANSIRVIIISSTLRCLVVGARMFVYIVLCDIVGFLLIQRTYSKQMLNICLGRGFWGAEC